MNRKGWTKKAGAFGAPFDISPPDVQAMSEYASTLELVRRAEKIQMEISREIARIDQTSNQTIEFLRSASPEERDQLVKKGLATSARAMKKIDRLFDESKRIVSIVMRLN